MKCQQHVGQFDEVDPNLEVKDENDGEWEGQQEEMSDGGDVGVQDVKEDRN